MSITGKQQRMLLLRDAVRYQREAGVYWTKNPRHAAWCEKMASKIFDQAAKLYD